jgi:hypothetical protein
VETEKSRGHILFDAGNEYFELNGSIYRASISDYVANFAGGNGVRAGARWFCYVRDWGFYKAQLTKLFGVSIVVNKDLRILQVYKNINSAMADMFVKFGPVDGPERYYQDADYWHPGRLDLNKQFYHEYVTKTGRYAKVV